MEVKKFSMIKEGTILDNLRKEQEEKNKVRDQKNSDLDDDLKARQAAHKKDLEPVGIDSTPDFNIEKTEVVDKISEIVFYSLKSGNRGPLNEINALIDKYSEYLRTKVLSPVPSAKPVQTFTDYNISGGSEAKQTYARTIKHLFYKLFNRIFVITIKKI